MPEPRPLWTGPREQAASVQADPNAAKVTVGIGSIVNEIDGTTESFGLYQYLVAHPIAVRGAKVAVTLIDAPADATYAVSGKVQGSIGFSVDSKPGASIAGSVLTTAGAVGAIVSGVAAAKASTPEGKDSGVGAAIGFGALGGTGLVVLGVGLSRASAHNRYDWDQLAFLTLRRKGQRVDPLDFGFMVHARGGYAGDGVQGLHDTALAPVWEAVRLRLAARIQKDLAEGKL